MGTVGNIILVLLFILVGGVFAATEIALVSLRDSQIRAMELRGRRGERTAALARDPNRFLSAVQIGVTVAGFFSAAYGASAIAPSLSPTLHGWGLSVNAADAVALIGTTLVIAYLSLILGELVPKRVALQRSSGVSMATGPALDIFARLMRPVIWLLSASTNAVVRLLGGDPDRAAEDVTPEELRDMLTGHHSLPEDQRTVLSEVFDAGNRSLTEVMRPRTEVDCLSADLTVTEARSRALELGHSRLPVVVGGSLDDVVGFVHIRDLFGADPDSGATAEDLCRPLVQYPGTRRAISTLAEMQRENTQFVLVIDEYGGAAGIATMEDIVEELVGEIGDEFDPQPEPGLDLSEGVEVEGLLLVDDVVRQTGVDIPQGPYDTIAGYLMHELQRVPRIADSVTVDGHRLSVVALDGYRVDRIRISLEEKST